MIEKRIINDVLDKVKLTELMPDYGIQLDVKGRKARCCCPFHDEKTQSFSVDIDKNLWHCFGCGKGGNVIDFVMEKEHLSFPLAVRKLMKDKLGQSLSDEEMQISLEEKASIL